MDTIIYMKKTGRMFRARNPQTHKPTKHSDITQTRCRVSHTHATAAVSTEHSSKAPEKLRKSRRALPPSPLPPTKRPPYQCGISTWTCQAADYRLGHERINPATNNDTLSAVPETTHDDNREPRAWPNRSSVCWSCPPSTSTVRPFPGTGKITQKRGGGGRGGTRWHRNTGERDRGGEGRAGRGSIWETVLGRSNRLP